MTGPERETWLAGPSMPGAVAFPVSADEVAGLLARASEEGLRVVAAGAGTALGIATADPPDLVLSTARMTAVTEYEPADLTLTAEAGLTLGALDAATRENGQWLPLDPPGADEGTLGGLLATGAAGPLQAEFGTPRDHVLGLTLVTGDGRILEVGGRVVKNVAGYDLVRLATGSRGGLGVVTRATVRLHPVPEADAALVLSGASLEELVAPALSLATAPVIVSALELAEPDPRSKAGAVLAARMVGSREAVDHALDLLEGEAGASGAGDAEVLRGEDAPGLFRSLARRETGDLVLRLALLPGQLEELVAAGRELSRAWAEEELRPTLAAHVTRGRLRVALSELPRKGGAPTAPAEAVEEARRSLESRGGSLKVLAGPPGLAAGSGRGSGDGGRVADLQAGIKDAFDPAGILPEVGVTG